MLTPVRVQRHDCTTNVIYHCSSNSLIVCSNRINEINDPLLIISTYLECYWWVPVQSDWSEAGCPVGRAGFCHSHSPDTGGLHRYTPQTSCSDSDHLYLLHPILWNIKSTASSLNLLHGWNPVNEKMNINIGTSLSMCNLINYEEVSSQTLTPEQMSCWQPSAQRYERVGLGEHPSSSAAWSCPLSCQWPPSGSPPTHQSAPWNQSITDVLKQLYSK